MAVHPRILTSLDTPGLFTPKSNKNPGWIYGSDHMSTGKNLEILGKPSKNQETPRTNYGKLRKT